jgi:hypothetical protein
MPACWLGARLSVPVSVGAETARILETPRLLPRIRRWLIGQPPALREPFAILQNRMLSAGGALEVIAAPGHCDDHVLFYDAAEKLLIAGDTFMGVYFSAPNPDVDSLKWIATLRRLLELEIEILVEGHGFVHTLRPDVPDVPSVVVRHHPREEILEKLRFFEWLCKQIESGLRGELPIRAVEVSCFPWAVRLHGSSSPATKWRGCSARATGHGRSCCVASSGFRWMNLCCPRCIRCDSGAATSQKQARSSAIVKSRIQDVQRKTEHRPVKLSENLPAEQQPDERKASHGLA